MRWALIALAALLSTQDVPTPHGPYADRDGWVCYQGDTIEAAKRVHCACKMPCENQGLEDRACQTYCASKKCLCHTDDSCDHVHP